MTGLIRRENVLIISTFHDFPSATDCDKSVQIVNSSPHKNPHSGKSHGKRQLADPPGSKNSIVRCRPREVRKKLFRFSVLCTLEEAES